MRTGEFAPMGAEADSILSSTPIAALGAVMSGLVVLVHFVDSPWLVAAGAAAGLAMTVACVLHVQRRGKVLGMVLSFLSTESIPKLSSETTGLLGEELAGLVGRQAEARRELQVLRAGLVRSSVPALLCDDKDQVILASETFSSLTGKRLPQSGPVGVRSLVGGDLPSNFDKAVFPEGYVAEIETSDGSTIRARCLSASLGAGLGRLVHIIPLAQKRKSLEDAEKQRELIVSTARTLCSLAQRLTSASKVLNASAEKQVAGAKQQKSQADSVAVAMEEMASSVVEVARNASATSEAVNEARSVAQEGGAMVKNAVEGIASVATSASELAASLSSLERQSSEIGRIMEVIGDIADQTNLLALNAAIEAARAGDAGRGFAVVADEVRKLAEKTVSATKEVDKAIQSIQGSTKEAVSSMARTSRKVEESTRLSSSTGDSLARILARIEDVVGRTSQIATAAEEQSATAEEISRHIQDVASIATSFSDGAAQEAEAVEELHELSQELLKVAQGMSDDNTCGMPPEKPARKLK